MSSVLPVRRLLDDFRVDNFLTSSSKRVELVSRAAILVDGDLYVVWQDDREGDWNIYLQRFKPYGKAVWPADLQVNTDSTDTTQSSPALTYGRLPSGAEWLFVVWEDQRNGDWDIYAQKISLDGEHDWAEDLRVNTDTGTANQYKPRLVFGDDGSGTSHLFFVWEDSRNPDQDIFAQKYLPSGVSAWGDYDRTICNAGNTQSLPAMTLHSGMLYMAWQDSRNGNWDIYAQKMSAVGAGEVKWGNGAAIATQAGSQTDPEIVMASDGQHLYVAWESDQDAGTTGWDIRADRLTVPDTGPESQWSGGQKVNVDSGYVDQYDLTLALDTMGYLYVAWEDWRTGNSLVYAQKLADDSLPQWPSASAPADQLMSSNPVAGAGQYDPAMVLDVANARLFVVWEDFRNSYYYDDLYGQRSDLNANLAWAADKRMNMDTGAVESWRTPSMAVTGANHLYVAWTDYRNGQSSDIFVQAYNSDGERQLPDTDVRLASDEYVTDTYRYDPSLVVGPDGYLYGVWEDNLYNPNYDIASQKWPLDMSGDGEWGYPGKDPAFNNNTDDYERRDPVIVASGTATESVVFAVWREKRGADFDLYAQKRALNGNVDPSWPGGDLLVHDSTFDQYEHDAAVDNVGNVYVVWSDLSAVYPHIYARKITPEGFDAWGGPRQIDLDAGGPYSDTILSPEIAMGLTGQYFYVVWSDYREGETNIYAQKFTLDGSRVWTSQDVSVNRTKTGAQINPDVAVDADGYIYVMWEDWRNGNADIYSQLLNPNGIRVWSYDQRIDDSTDSTDQMKPRIVMLNNQESFFVTWVDRRGGNRHIYANKWGQRFVVYLPIALRGEIK